MEIIIGKYNYWIYIVLMMIGFYAMIAKTNMIKKIVGMNIFQTAIILFFISAGFKKNATIPIILKSQEIINPTQYINPLPHVLMLTAIVVMVSTFGVALALAIILYKKYKTLDEDEILDVLREKK